jgi:hypothetical protein
MNLGRNRVGMCGQDSSGTGWGPVTGFSEHEDEPLCSVKGR